MRLFLFVFLISFSALATSWENLEVGSTYKLTQSFQLPQTERSGSLMDFMKGEQVTLNEIVPIYVGYSLMLYVFDYKNCPGKEMAANMEIIPVEGTNPLVEAGALLNKNCELNVYIETKDYYSKSLFE